MTDTRVIVLVGSLRADSVNRKLAELLRDQASADVTLDLVDGLGELPFYNEDVDNEQDVPEAARLVYDDRGRAMVLFEDNWPLRFFGERNPTIELSPIPFDRPEAVAARDVKSA